MFTFRIQPSVPFQVRKINTHVFPHAVVFQAIRSIVGSMLPKSLLQALSHWLLSLLQVSTSLEDLHR